MTPYELLSTIVSRIGLDEANRKDADACIREMEKLNVLGTLAQQINAVDHQHVESGPFTAYDQTSGVWHRITTCQVCHSEMSDTMVEAPRWAYRPSN